jgi:hypothetical protein
MPVLDESTCTCSHDESEHGGDPEFPGARKCNVEDCDCLHFEAE